MKIRLLHYLADIFLVFTLCLLFGVTSCRSSLRTKSAEVFKVDTIVKVNTSIRTDTLVRPLISVEFIDTTECPPNLKDTTLVIKERTVQLPQDTIFYEVECVDTISIYQDADRMSYMVKANQELKQQLQIKQNQAVTRLWIIIGLGVVTLVFAVLAIKN